MNAIYAGLEGLQRAEAKLDRTASRLASFPLSGIGPPEDVVDLSAEAVALITAEHAFEANLKSIESAAELTDSVVDLLG